MKRVFSLLCAMALCIIYTTAKSPQHLQGDTIIADTLRINYPLSQTHFDPTYMGNDTIYNKIIDYLRRSPRMDSIIIRSFASPEGPYENNARLARNRGITARKCLQELLDEYRELSDAKIIIDPTPENWRGLRDLIVAEYDRPDRQQLLEIIDKPNITPQNRKWRIQRLDAGKTWRYIIKHYMPRLRYAEWTFVLVAPPPIEEKPQPVKPEVIPLTITPPTSA